jgi:hypothetical protein
MLLFLRELGDSVREFQYVRKIVDRKDPSQAFDPIDLDDVPVRDLGMQLGDLVIRQGRGVLSTRDTLHLRQCLHRLLAPPLAGPTDS